MPLPAARLGGRTFSGGSVSGGRNWNDILFGTFLIVSGAVGVFLIGDLRLGTAMRMGPGYVPTLLCWLTIGFGVVIGLRGCVAHGPPLTTWALRPLIAVSAAIGLFMSVERIGLGAAVIGLTLIASLGDRETRWAHAIGLAVLLAVFASVVFVRLLGLPFPLWPAVLGR